MRVAPLARSDLQAARRVVSELGAPLDLEAEFARPEAILLGCTPPGAEGPLAILAAWHVADELQVLYVGTLPGARRRGLARALLERLLEEGQARAVRLVVLEVRAGNHAALALYQGLGFRVVRTRPRYYQDPVEDAREMHLVYDPRTGRFVPPGEPR